MATEPTPGPITAEELDQVATQVATALARTWTVEPETDPDARRWNPSVTFAGPHGERITLSGDGRRHERYVIRGSYPGTSQDLAGIEHRPWISVLRTTPPAQIARHLLRRFLPAYRQTLAQVVARVDRREQYTRQKTATTRRFWQLLEPQHPQIPAHVLQAGEFTFKLAGEYGRCQALGDGRVKLELTLTDDLAAQVMTLINQMAPS